MKLNKYLLVLLVITFAMLAVNIQIYPAYAVDQTVQNVEDTPFSSDTSVDTPQTQSDTGLGPVLVAVVLFFCILVAVGFVVKRINRTAATVSPWCKVLDKQQLGQGQYLYLVELAGRMQILGVSSNSVTKISELVDADLATEIMQDLAWRAQQTLPPWWSKLSGLLKRNKFASELGRLDREDFR